MNKPLGYAAVVFLTIFSTGPVGTAWAAWTSVGPGIEYQQFNLPDPNRVYVARMDRQNSACFVDSTLGYNRLGSSETIGGQASRFDDAISYWHHDWGKRNDVIVAINGDFVDTSTNTPLGGQVMSGWYTKTLTGSSRRFCYQTDQGLGIANTSLASQRVSFAPSGDSLTIQGHNRVRGSDELVVYTPQYGVNTKTDNTGVEVLVEMTRPAGLQTGADAAVGYIRQIRQNAGSTSLPFDHVVLSATGTAASNLLARAQIGGRVGLSFQFWGYPVSMEKTYSSIAGGETFLGDGIVWGGQDVRHPRTAVAYNDRYLYFVVVDGRSSSSIGMTMTEIGNFCKDYLDATWGQNLDGGGSSTMIVNGVLKNRPSDGSQRSVVNGMFMGVLQPKLQTMTYNPGDVVKTTGTSNTVRLGPGTNYLSLTTVGRNVEGTVLDHHLRGVYAKGYYWWKCDFNGTVGWVAHNLLTPVSTGNLPRFTQQPTIQEVCPGGTGVFSVAATGTGTLSYRWQFNGTDLNDGGAYSGVTTPTLVVANAGTAQIGSYRCRVTGSTGTTTSWSAPLRVMATTTILTQPQSRINPLVVRGTNVAFSVWASGEGTLAYRWQKNGVNLGDSGKYTGTATPELTVWAVDATDEGEYRCVITGGCATASSNAASLAVLTPDFDRDGYVDQADFGHLQACFTGPTVPQTDPSCWGTNLDADASGDVDSADLDVFLGCMREPGTPRPEGC